MLLDTAGRYTVQESSSQQSAQEWKSFLGLLRKYRPRQPINGVIITIDMSDLINGTSEEYLEQAYEQHKRLVELRKSLKIDFPVYIMVTKVDLLRGFVAYFNQYNKQKRDQIWGVTFARSETEQSDFSLKSAFDYHFNLLAQRLKVGLSDAMLNEQDKQLSSEMYLFPQAFSRIGQTLSDYLNALFATSNFEEKFIPRGIYFTSGTQKHMPFNPMASQKKETLYLTPNQEDGELTDDEVASNEQKNTKGYFLKNYLENVVFRESGLASNNRWWVYRSTTFHWVGYLVLGVLFFTFASFLYKSYSNNSQYLSEVNSHIPAIERQSHDMELYTNQDIFILLPYLNHLKTLATSTDFSLTSVPMSYRFGLYRSTEVETASNTLYQKALKNILLPYVAWQVTSILQHDIGNDPDFSFEALKAYRMLYEPEHYDGKFLRAWLIFNLQRTSSPSTSQSAWRALDSHLADLLDNNIQTSPYLRDQQLEYSAKQKINQKPVSERIYGRLKRTLLKEASLKSLSLNDLAGAQANLVFQSKSGDFSSTEIPGLYTPKGYWLAFNKRIDNVTDILVDEDGWVLDLDDSALNKTNRHDLQKTVRLLYMQDFVSTWDNFLNDIELKNIATLQQRISTARILSAEDSPMRNLLVNVVKNVRFVDGQEPQEGDKAQEKDPESFLHQLFTNQQGNENSGENGDLSSQPEQVILKHFAAIIELTANSDGETKNIAFDTVIKQTDTLYNYLLAVESATNSGMSPPSGEILLSLQAEAGRLPQPFKEMILSLAMGASRDSQVKEVEALKKNVEFDVRDFCHQAIEGRYPLVRSATKEITTQDFSHMFAPNSGLMDSFFNKNLDGKIDTSRSTWRFYPNIDNNKALSGGANSILRSFQQARIIRDTWFSNQSQKPYYTLAIKPVSMDVDILTMTLDFDGQVFRYSHGPLVPLIVSWPGVNNTNQITMNLTLADGKTATLVTSGDWALHRLLDKAKIKTEGSSLSQTATFNVEGHQVVMEFTPNSVRNPFQPISFNCP